MEEWVGQDDSDITVSPSPHLMCCNPNTMQDTGTLHIADNDAIFVVTTVANHFTLMHYIEHQCHVHLQMTTIMSLSLW